MTANASDLPSPACVTVGLAAAGGAATTTAAGSPSASTSLIRGGMVYDGTGAPGVRADVGIRGDRIATIGDLGAATAHSGRQRRPASRSRPASSTCCRGRPSRSSSTADRSATSGRASRRRSSARARRWARSPTEMKTRWKSEQGDIKFDYAWTTLAGYLQFLEKTGVTPNVASFIGAGTIREHVVGLDEPQADAGRARSHARARAPGNGSRRARHRVVAHLRARLRSRRRRS